MYEVLFKSALKNWNEFKKNFEHKYSNPFIEYNDENYYLFNEWILVI